MAKWIGLASGQWTTIWQSGLALSVEDVCSGKWMSISCAADGSDADNVACANIACLHILLWRYRVDYVGRRLSCANGQGLARRCP